MNHSPSCPRGRVAPAAPGLQLARQAAEEPMHLLVLRSGLDPSAIRAAAPSALLCDTAWRCSPAEALALLQRPGYATVVADARAVESSPEGWALRRLLDDRVRSRTARLTWVVVEDCKAPGPALEPGVR